MAAPILAVGATGAEGGGLVLADPARRFRVRASDGADLASGVTNY